MVMMPEAGFKKVHVDMSFPDVDRAARTLAQLKEQAGLVVTVVEASVLEHEALFELDVMGLPSKVDEVLRLSRRGGASLCAIEKFPIPEGIHAPPFGASRTADRGI